MAIRGDLHSPQALGRAIQQARALRGMSQRDLAAELGIGALLVKDESDRLGLPAFKVLGSSWAIYRQAAEMLGMTFRSFRYFAKKYGLTGREAPAPANGAKERAAEPVGQENTQ